MSKTIKHKKLDGKPEDFVFLVVDDDGQVRDILTGYLKSFGFKKVHEAKDGKTALKMVQNHQQRIDFIISDWEMPHIDGLTLLRAVRKDPARSEVKFLMVSSQSSRERIKISEAAKSYVDAYVVKPFRANTLLEKIKNLIEHGVDPSADDFDNELKAVPHNDEVFANPPPLGKTTVKEESQAMGNLRQVLDHELNPGHVTVQENVKTPPEQYDLKQMNLTLILNLCKSYQKVKWLEKSIKLCNDALFLFPNNADIYYQLAHTYYIKGDWEEASFNLKRVTQIAPYHAEAQTLIAEIAVKKVA